MKPFFSWQPCFLLPGHHSTKVRQKRVPNPYTWKPLKYIENLNKSLHLIPSNHLIIGSVFVFAFAFSLLHLNHNHSTKHFTHTLWKLSHTITGRLKYAHARHCPDTMGQKGNSLAWWLTWHMQLHWFQKRFLVAFFTVHGLFARVYKSRPTLYF